MHRETRSVIGHITLPLLGGALALLATLHIPSPARACTAFGLRRGAHVVVGKSYDWHQRAGLLVLNKRGVAKRALLLRPAAKPASWVSRYGSVTFTQYGRDMPLGGINERGLVVEVLWLNQARYGTPDPRRETVNELQLIQYMLDTAATTGQALAAARRLQIVRAHARVHYLVCDRDGACATLEHLGGKLVAHHGSELPAPLLTNSTYRVARRHLRKHQGFGGKQATPKSARSLARFVRAASMLRATPKAPGAAALVKRGFAILDSVHIPHYSRWNIVYTPRSTTLRARLIDRRRGAAAKTLLVDLRKLDFGCATPVKLLDLSGAITGKARVWQPYTRSANRKLVRFSLRKLRLKLPAPVQRRIVRYPERTRCVQK
jgi:penicillin V acylase-like amidase (Ntn superfamily)